MCKETGDGEVLSARLLLGNMGVLWVAEGSDSPEQMWLLQGRAAGKADAGQELPSLLALHQTLQLGLSLVREKRQDCATGKCV